MLILHTYAEIKWKVSKSGVFSGLHFPVFGLNTEISIQIQENSVFMLHFAYVAEFPCCNISTFTFFALQFFHVVLFSCCIFSSFISSFWIFLLLHSYHVALFSWWTLLMLHYFHVAPFCVALFLIFFFFIFFRFALFSCCTFLILKSIENVWNKESTTIKTKSHSELRLFHLYFTFLRRIIATIFFWSEKKSPDQGVAKGTVALPNIL